MTHDPLMLPRSFSTSKASFTSFKLTTPDDGLKSPPSPALKRFMSLSLAKLHIPPIRLNKHTMQRYQSQYKLGSRPAGHASHPFRRAPCKQFALETSDQPDKSPLIMPTSPSVHLTDTQKLNLPRHYKSKSQIGQHMGGIGSTTLPSLYSPKSFLQQRADLARSVMDFCDNKFKM